MSTFHITSASCGSITELSYNRSVVESLLEHDLVCKETATYHLLVDRLSSEKREADKEAGAVYTTRRLL